MAFWQGSPSGPRSPAGPQTLLKPEWLPPHLCAKASSHREVFLLCWVICTISLWVFCCIFSHAGGEGSVLAAACSVIGVGSDIGGSIRMPAFFNGVFGHKPTTGKEGMGVSSPPQQRCQEVDCGLWEEPVRDTPLLVSGEIAERGQAASCHGTSPLHEYNLALAVESHLVAECQACGRCFTPDIVSSAWDVFPRSGSGVFPWQLVTQMDVFLLSPPCAPCRQLASTADVCSPWTTSSTGVACPGWRLCWQGGTQRLIVPAGVVPNDGQFPNARGVRTSFLCTGPMCRYAEDLELMLRVMAGPGVSR